MYSQAQASTIYKSLNQYHVVLESEPKFTTSPEVLNQSWIQNSGGSVPLLVVASLRRVTGPLTVNYTGLYPSSTISFNLAPNVSLSQRTELIHDAEVRQRH